MDKTRYFTSEKIINGDYFYKTGQQYNITGSSKYAMLNETFAWTCDMFIPPNQTIRAVKFLRNWKSCGLIGLAPECKLFATDPNYIYGCLSEFSFTLTIPAENMTESEQGSVWRCEYVGDSTFRSPNVTLNIASK